jgi:2-phospho-L-lactate/phosphoenolpyruvate guanylyltransferase
VRTLAVLPVKRFDAAKQRLAATLGPGARAELAEAMLADVLAALVAAREVERVAVVTAEERAVAAARATGAEVVDDPAEAGQSPAATRGIVHALAAGYDRVLLVPGDTPLLDPARLDDLLVRSKASLFGAAIVPDRHGTGTNALLLSPPDALAPRFGPDSLARHLTAARGAGIAYAVERVEALEHDVDTPDDLAALAIRLPATGPGRADRTCALLPRLGHAPSGPAGRPRAVAEA